MKIITPIIAVLAMAAPASAENYRIDLFGGSAPDQSFRFDNRTYDMETQQFYGLSLERLDAFMPNLDLGLEYSFHELEYSDTTLIDGTSLLVTTTYSWDASDEFALYGTLGLGVVEVNYHDTIGGTSPSRSDTVGAGMVGIGGRFTFDQFSIFAEYRHLATLQDPMVASTSAAAVAPAEFSSQTIAVGIGFGF